MADDAESTEGLRLAEGYRYLRISPEMSRLPDIWMRMSRLQGASAIKDRTWLFLARTHTPGRGEQVRLRGRDLTSDNSTRRYAVTGCMVRFGSARRPTRCRSLVADRRALRLSWGYPAGLGGGGCACRACAPSRSSSEWSTLGRFWVERAAQVEEPPPKQEGL